jgi:hypothetical protein
MSVVLRSILVLSVVMALGQPASAATRFRAIITHDQEISNPPVPFQGTSGIGWFVLSDDMTSLSYDIQLFGLDLDGLQTPAVDDNVTRTHFHAAPTGANGGIVYGQIDGNVALRNDLDDLVVGPMAGTLSGVWDGLEGNNTTLAAQLPNLLAGNLYFNVHTSDHAGGEIRGQILYVPEPATWLGLAVAIGGCWLVRRQRLQVS